MGNFVKYHVIISCTCLVSQYFEIHIGLVMGFMEFLKQNEIDSKSKKESQEDIKSKMSALSKLQIVFKLP